MSETARRDDADGADSRPAAGESRNEAGATDGSPDPGWQLLGTRAAFECPWFRVRQDEIRLPGGEEITYNVVEHDGWTLIVPLLDDGRVVMERIYRWTFDRWVLECPSGGLDGEEPEHAARRELEEETGHRAGELVHLGRFAASNGYTNESYHVYLARDVRPDGRVAREATEQIELALIPLEELRAMALRGEIEDGPSTLALLLAADHVARHEHRNEDPAENRQGAPDAKRGG